MDNSIVISAPDVPGADEVFTAGALAFLEALHRRFAARRRELLDLRQVRRETVALHGTLDFLPETAEVRAADWQVAPIPDYLADRRVEITGPTDRKMTINALNSGAKVWLADLEDANTPAWPNIVEGQLSLRDAIRGEITLEQNGKSYRLDRGPLAVIVTRPRGWHLNEKHLTLDGEQCVGALVDFGLYLFHNAQALIDKGEGPAFYLPKMESHLEARLWAEVFDFSEEYLGLEHGVIKATVLIETIWAAFEMDEILYELRDHIVGLNAGRWDYLFSIVKTFRDAGPAFVLPERQVVTMASPFMKAYSDLLVRTCHRRGAYAIGGMAAFIPSRKDPEVNAAAFAKVRADKTREAEAGYEGSWVAHPDLVPICQEIFDGVLGGRPNQLSTGVATGDRDGRRPARRGGGRRTGDDGRPRGHHRDRARIHRELARRSGRGGHPQPDGRRGHGRDLAVAGVAVAGRGRGAGHRPAGHRRADHRRAGPGHRAALGVVGGRTRRSRVAGPGAEPHVRPVQRRLLHRFPDPAGV